MDRNIIKDKYLKYKIKYYLLKKYYLDNNELNTFHNTPNKSCIFSEEKTIENPVIPLSISPENNNLGIWNKQLDELYIIGDVHGDFFALKQALELTNCVLFDPYQDKINYDEKNKLYNLKDGCEYYKIENNNVKWNPEKKNCFIVFAGDLIDRCRNNHNNKDCINTINDENCDYLILKLIFDLDKQAREYNSRIIVVLGNHEIMHIQGEFKYVSKKGKDDQNRIINIDNYLSENIDNIFGIIRINNYIIVHGGINNHFFSKLNKKNLDDSIESIEYFNKELRKIIIDKNPNDNLFGLTSPFWDRTLGGLKELNKNQCQEIFDKNLLKIKEFNNIKETLKIIVAHCPQFILENNINLIDCQEYKNRIYRIDIGMSRAFDFYDNDKINIALKNNTFINNYKNYNYYYLPNQAENRYISCLKIYNNKEDILKGITSIGYFFKNTFNNDKDRLLYLLSDIKKIYLLNNYSEYIKLIDALLDELSIV